MKNSLECFTDNEQSENKQCMKLRIQMSPLQRLDLQNLTQFDFFAWKGSETSISTSIYGNARCLLSLVEIHEKRRLSRIQPRNADSCHHRMKCFSLSGSAPVCATCCLPRKSSCRCRKCCACHANAAGPQRRASAHRQSQRIKVLRLPRKSMSVSCEP